MSSRPHVRCRPRQAASVGRRMVPAALARRSLWSVGMILTVPSNRYHVQSCSRAKDISPQRRCRTPRQAGRGKNTVSSGFEGPWTRGSEQHLMFSQSAGSPSCIDGRRSEKWDVGRQELWRCQRFTDRQSFVTVDRRTRDQSFAASADEVARHAGTMTSSMLCCRKSGCLQRARNLPTLAALRSSGCGTF